MVKVKLEEAHILLEDADVKWYWSRRDMNLFRQMWRDGKSGEEIAEALGVNLLSVALLVVDQEIIGNIKPRPGGLLGE
ncbi:helix-turn-helix domain containing protein [Sporosarcina saromensis]|uniref:Helix-turn-helix domain containing protein n=1 Tax=Sporosarcina saromensis TaxID=359365 RepID=A0ABU4GDX9_9BACL|nr:helix-turn-helix domain containing protein [Sporosarcina saromensis]MDW0113782.1 helix-turn-helix domain containing protein [Sporosarcina saromensis]